MNVTCPQCATVFRVDPAKVPERGIRARCSVCSGLIAVRRPPATLPAVPPESEAIAAAPVAAPIAAPPQPAVARPAAVNAPVPAPAPIVPPPAPPTPPPAQVAAPVPQPAPVAPAHIPAPPVVRHEPPAVRAPEPVYQPPAPAPAFAPPVAPAPAPAAPTAPARFSNPFLQRDSDPSTRARRLANSLASDLAFYYPEKRTRGLQDGNLKELFAEEIRRSWDEYVDQVGEEYANSTSFFTQALNEILAEGRPHFG